MKRNGKKILALALTLSLGISAIATPVNAKWVQENNGKWWYYDSNPNNYAKNGWKKIDGVWYYFDRSGYMKTGWVQDGLDWYYLNSSGKMVTGWNWINGKCYYLDSSGAMASDSIIEGSYVDASGAWIKGTSKSYTENSNIPDFGALFGVDVAQKTIDKDTTFYGYIDNKNTFTNRMQYYGELLKSKGFTYKGTDEDGDSTYEQKINGDLLTIYMGMGSDGHTFSVFFFYIPDLFGDANSSSGTSSNGITYYSGHATIPDYGAYLGVKTVFHKADETTDSYAYIGTKSSLDRYNDLLLDQGFVRSTSTVEDGLYMNLYHYNGSEKAVLGTSYDPSIGTIMITIFLD